MNKLISQITKVHNFMQIACARMSNPISVKNIYLYCILYIRQFMEKKYFAYK